MQSFFAAIASFWGRLSRPLATALGDPGVPAEPPASPVPGADNVAAMSQPGATTPVETASRQTGPAVSESPGPSISGASPPESSTTNAGRGRSRRRPTAAAADRVCPWCSAAVRASDAVCPNCGATLDAAAADQVAIPGLTELPPKLRRYAEAARSGKKQRQSLLKMMFSDAPIPTVSDAPPPSDADALRPPSAAVRAEMARLDLDIAAGRPARPANGDEPAAPSVTAPDPAGGDKRT